MATTIDGCTVAITRLAIRAARLAAKTPLDNDLQQHQMECLIGEIEADIFMVAGAAPSPRARLELIQGGRDG